MSYYFGEFDDYALSRSQEAIWLSEKLEIETNAFCIPLLIEILGPIDIDKIKDAFKLIVRKHEALRTIIPIVNERAIQRVYQEASIEINEIILDDNDIDSLIAFTKLQSKKYLDPSIETLRVSLAKINPITNYLFIEIHHLICDGWSAQIISKDLSAAYLHLTQSDSNVAPLTETEYQYVDWSEWQKSQVENAVNREYWESRLYGTKNLSPLVISDDTEISIEAEYLIAKISSEEIKKIEFQCAKFEITSFEWFLNSLVLLISKYHKNDEIWISTPWANRSYEEFFETIGCFVDTVPLRLKVSRRNTFSDALDLLKSQVRSDLSHAENSGEIIRRILRECLPAGVATQPNVLFAYQVSTPKIDFGKNIKANLITVENQNAKFDFTFRIDPNQSDGNTQIIFEYRKSCISKLEAGNFLNDLISVISIFANDYENDLTLFKSKFSLDNINKFPQKDSHQNPLISDQAESISFKLEKLWSKLLSQDVHSNDNFFTLGGDSILALRLISLLKENGITCKPRDIFENPTPISFANNLLLKQLENQNIKFKSALDQSNHLLPIERWFFNLELKNFNHWFQAISLSIPIAQDSEKILNALTIIHEMHKAFSYRWKRNNSTYEFFTNNDAQFELIELTNEQSFNNVESDLNRINIESGPLSIIFYHSGQTTRLLWVIHHLIIDTLSWRVLIDDLINIIFNRKLNQGIRSVRNRDYLDGDYVSTEEYSSYWNQQYEIVNSWNHFDSKTGTYAEEKKIRHDFSNRTTSEIDNLEKLGFNAEEVLLTALLNVFSFENFPQGINITLEHHGRDLDLIESIDSIGWYTAIAPFALDRCSGNLTDQLARVISGLARWKTMAPTWLKNRENLSNNAKKLPLVSFNYLGRLQQPSDAPIHITPLPEITLHDPQGVRPFLHEILLWRDADGYHLFWLTNQEQTNIELEIGFSALENHVHELHQEILYKGKSAEVGVLAAGLIFHSGQITGENAYYGQVTGKINGSINLDLFQSCWSALIERHDSLRASFPIREDGRMIRFIQKQVNSPIKYIDLSLDIQSQSAIAQEFLRKELVREFDLRNAPLFRMALIKFNLNEWMFCLTYHHAILDGWSLPILLDELLELYDSNTLATRELPPSTEQIIRSMYSRNPVHTQICWKEILNLRTDSGRLMLPFQSNVSRSTTDLKLSNELKNSLTSLASKEAITFGSLLQAVWAVTLQSLGFGSTPCFGLIISDRDPTVQGINKFVGLTINTLPMVVDARNAHNILSIAKNVQNLFSKMQSHAEIDLPSLQKWAHITNEPLFDTLFVLENYPRNRMSGKQISFNSIEMIEQAHYPMTLAVIPDDEITFRLSCNNQLITNQLAQSILRRYHVYLEIISEFPNIECRELKNVYQIRSKDKSQFNNKALASKFQSIYSIILNSSNQYPELIAVRQGSEKITYSELISRSSNYAAQLSALGVQRGSIVALSCYRTIDWITTIVACSHIGAAFICIDRDLPKSRQEQIIRLCKPHLLVSNPYLELDSNFDINQIQLSQLSSSTLILNTPAVCELSEEDLAYLVFTSGSTGEPKKVAIPHRGINNFKNAQADDFDIQPGDAIYQFASPSYDAFISEFITSLGTGASLCLPRHGRSQIHEDFISDLTRYNITHITLTPSLIYSLPKNALSTIKTLVVAGERSTANQLIDHRTANRRIINAYGPSEATCSVTQSHWTDSSDPVLGLPIKGAEIYLLDHNLFTLEKGVISEIYIGGVGLAWGYLDNPRLTAEKFIPNPFSKDPGQRIYKTGDLAYLNQNNQIVYVGRADNQIKLRGQRIEPGEIEFAINNYPGVTHSHVKIQFNGETPHLAAWVLSDVLEHEDLHDIYSKIQNQLPAAMLPSHWHITKKWPTNQFGKVDYSLLPMAEILYQSNNLIVDGGSVSIVEGEKVTSIWSQTLNKIVNGNETLIQLGGDSITAMRIVAQINALGYEIKASDLLSGMTPNQIVLKGKKVLIQESKLKSAPLSPTQSLFFRRNQHNFHNWIFSAQIKLEKGIDLNMLHQAAQEIILRHDALRAYIDPDRLVQTLGELHESQIMHSPTIISSNEVIAGVNSLINISSGPNFVVYIDSEKMIIAGQHLWLDIVSIHIIVDEMQSYIKSPNSLKYDVNSYFNWSSKLSFDLGNGLFNSEIEYWNRITKITTDLKLVIHGKNPLESEVERHISRISHKNFANFSSLDIEALLLTALISGFFSQDETGELLIELERHGRDTLNDFEATNIVGWFTASFPIRLIKHANIEAEMITTKAMLETVPNKGSGFSSILAKTNSDDLNISFDGFFSHCQISFNYLGNLSIEKNNMPGFGCIDINADLHNIAEDKLTRQRPISVEAWSVNDGIEIRWTYSKKQWTNSQDVFIRFDEYINKVVSQNFIVNTIGSEEFNSLLDELELPDSKL